MWYAGLNGIEVLDKDLLPIRLSIENLDAKPRDMNSIPGYAGDHRVLDNLINGENNTSNDKNMWLIPFNKGEHHFIYIDL